MAAADLLTLRNPIAARLIRCLYMLVLILIAILVILGLVRGVRTMMRTPPPPRPAIAQTEAPAPGATAPAPRPAARPARRFGPFMDRRFARPGFRRPGPRIPFGLGRNPIALGILIIIATLVRGAIALMVVRILAEMGLAVLAMPRRSEI